MDPKATVNAMLDALAAGDIEQAQWYTADLFSWVLDGGYVPTERL